MCQQCKQAGLKNENDRALKKGCGVLKKLALSSTLYAIGCFFMNMILQLNPTLLVETPLGRGHAIFILDYGMHQNTCWVVALERDGVVKHFDCNDIILATNFTYHVNLVKNKNYD